MLHKAVTDVSSLIRTDSVSLMDSSRNERHIMTRLLTLAISLLFVSGCLPNHDEHSGELVDVSACSIALAQVSATDYLGNLKAVKPVESTKSAWVI